MNWYVTDLWRCDPSQSAGILARYYPRRATQFHIESLRQKREALLAQLSGSGGIAQGERAIGVGEGGVGGDVGGHVIYAESGATVVIGEAPVKWRGGRGKTAPGGSRPSRGRNRIRRASRSAERHGSR